jgi:hypothetical protein
MINDNNPVGPVRQISSADSRTNTLDREPFAQTLTLTCGHWLVNTYGNRFPERHVGESLNCRLCGEANTVYDSLTGWEVTYP